MQRVTERVFSNDSMDDDNGTCAYGSQNAPSTVAVATVATCAALLGVTGAMLNCAVVTGVLGNAKLGTTINRLLVWICGSAMLESCLGMAAKVLILGQVIQNTVPAGMNELVCRCLIGASLVFTDCTVVLWTIINVYRLYLVVNTARRPTVTHHISGGGYGYPGGGGGRAGRGKSVAVSLRRQLLPAVGVFLGVATAIGNLFVIEPFVIYRECRGGCDTMASTQAEPWWPAAYLAVVICVYHVPSGLCYVLIYLIIRRRQRPQYSNSVTEPGTMAMKLLTAPGNDDAINQGRLDISPAFTDKDSSGGQFFDSSCASNDESVSNTIGRFSASALSLFGAGVTSKKATVNGDRVAKANQKNSEEDLATGTRKKNNNASGKKKFVRFALMSLPKRFSIRDMLEDQEGGANAKKEHENHEVATFVSGEENEVATVAQDTEVVRPFRKKEPRVIGKNVARKGGAQITIDAIDVEGMTHVTSRRGRRKRGSLPTIIGRSPFSSSSAMDPPQKPFLSDRLRRFTSADLMRKRKTSVEITGEGEDRCTVRKGFVAELLARHRRIRRKRRARKRNIVSAKLGGVSMLISLVIFTVIHLGYSQVPDSHAAGNNLVRALVNTLCFDGIICVASPLILLYGSRQLRQSLRERLNKTFKRAE